MKYRRTGIFLVITTFVLMVLLPMTDVKSKERTDSEWLIYGESLVIMKQYQKASDTALINVRQPSLRYHYLMGVCFINQAKWPEAIEHFRKAVNIDPNNERSMIALSYMGLGQALMETQQYQEAIDVFTIITKKYNANLAPDYPKYPVYLDDSERKINNIADDAQFYIAVCYEKAGERVQARNAYAKISRFYPFSSKLSEANEKVASLLGA